MTAVKRTEGRRNCLSTGLTDAKVIAGQAKIVVKPRDRAPPATAGTGLAYKRAIVELPRG
ncbi:MAG: hypothetical protein AAF251_08820 [Pseudomonadota bacterium]